MSDTPLEQRRRWYRHFPEGSLEFLVVTRVLAVLLLLTLIVLREAQRPFITAVLIGVLWFDYVLMMWWAIQVRLDLDAAAGRPENTAKRWLVGLKACLPSAIASAALSPWPVLFARQQGLATLRLAGMAVLFILFAVVAQRAMQRAGVGKPLWTALTLLPGIHWFAFHRIAAGLEARVQQQARERRPDTVFPHASSPALAVADATWVLCALPWLLVAVLTLIEGWPGEGPARMVPFCGMILAALFGVANLAALERVQRHFLQLIRGS
ncbi:MAG TPA: hypothetical protein VLM89_06805 [Phycisphaerae bacterium]|nr:hypothetical protein [Phycisphaerae bacterium]